MVTIKDVEKLLNTTAAALINDLVKYGVLRSLTGRSRNRIFWFAEYILIFSGQRNGG